MTDVPAADSAPAPAARCWTLVTADGALDVEVTAADAECVGAVVPALSRALGIPVTGLWAASTRIGESVPLAAPALAHGAVLGLDGPLPRSWSVDRSNALELHVVGGPDAGRTMPVGQGRHVLGRGAGATVRLDDPDVSRRHVAFAVGGGDITVADLDSTNGSTLDGRTVGPRPLPWALGARLRLGASTLALTGPAGAGATVEGSRNGRTHLRPAPRMTPPVPETAIEFPREPVPAPPRRLAWVAVALPAVAGVLMAWLLQTPTFLFFALLSPVVALGSWLGDRWTGRRTGRRDRAAYAAALAVAESRLAAAVEIDVRAAEAAHPDLAALVTAARRRSALLWCRGPADGDALVVRLGSGPGETRVSRVHGGTRLRASAERVPVTVDLRAAGGLGVVGPRERGVGVLRSVVAQLAALHPPGDLAFVLLAGADRIGDWVWARWLPHLAPGAVHVAAPRRALDGQGHGDRDDDERLRSWLAAVTARRRPSGAPGGVPGAPPTLPWLVVVVDRPLDGRLAGLLRNAREAGVLTLAAADSHGALPVPADAALRMAGETGDVAVLGRRGVPDRRDIVIDRLSPSIAGALSRDLAALLPATRASALPDSVRLADLYAGVGGVDAAAPGPGLWDADRDRLVATLGRSAEGPVEVDLCHAGPHALVAGTTGSGKSELLQTLIAGLALRHPPDRCSFLLVDYKGGAAFAEAAELPHTVGLVTDLDGRTTARALRSLTAELARREAILGAHGASDIAALPHDVALARLVIVVDEFATLAEELPAFVPGLVSIAQRGRSLGVHLVLATQRPGGVVSPEIRANCTLRICLRTTDEADSRDVLGATAAAHLPVDRPGRAYLRVGSGEPTLLQVARVASAPPAGGTTSPEVRRWTWPVVPRRAAGVAAPAGASDLVRLVHALGTRAAAHGLPVPHRPWRPPLPDVLPPATAEQRASTTPSRGLRLRLGLLDLPDRQAQEPLELDLGEGGGWLAVGGPRSGRSTLLLTVLAEAVDRLSPEELHVHVLDPGGAVAEAAEHLPHTGTSISGSDALRCVRLVERLAQEVAERRAAGASEGRPRILLLVDGAEEVTGILDDADPGSGSAALLRLVRDGGAAGVTCVVTADRAVPGGRLAAAMRQRVVLPLPDRADYAMAGIPPRAVPAHRPPGRALVGEDAVECQLTLPRTVIPRPPTTAGTLFPPVRITDLPPDPELPLPEARHGTADRGRLVLPLGPGGDEGAPLEMDLLRTGGLLIAGPPGSGRSSALDAFAQHLGALGTPLLRLGRPPGRASVPGPPAEWLEPDDLSGTARWLAERADRPRVVVADDVGGPGDARALDALATLGSRSGVVLLAAGSAGQLAGHYQGCVLQLRRSRSGLLLCPGSGEADVLGMRLPRYPLPHRPGSGWLVAGSRLDRVQVARRRATGAEGQPR